MVAAGRFVSVPVVTTAASRLSMGGSRVVPLRWLSCGRRAYWFTPTWRPGGGTGFFVAVWAWGSRVVPLRWLSCGRRAYWFTPTWRQGRVTAFLVTLWTGETRMALLRSIRAMLSV